MKNDARSESYNDSASSSNFTWSIHSGIGSDYDYYVGDVSDGSDHEHDKLCDDNQSSSSSNDQKKIPVSEVKNSANARVTGKLVSFMDTKVELLKIEVEINQHKITAVMDSGAGNSLMSHQLRHQLALELTPNDTVLTVIGEQDFNAIGTVNENMTIHGI